MNVKVIAVNHGPHWHSDLSAADNWLLGCGWWRVSEENADSAKYLIQHDGEKIIEVGRIVGWEEPAARHIADDPKLVGRKHFHCDPAVPAEIEALIGTPWQGSRNPVGITVITLTVAA